MSKEINQGSLVVEGVNLDDHPDYVDSYLSYGEYMDGSPISEDDLADMDDVAQGMAFESLLE